MQLWLSVDPLAEKYPSWSPYAYTFNNPVRFVDPDGRAPFDWVQLGGSVFWDSRVTNQAQAQKYWGESATYRAPNAFGSDATNGSGYILFGENREWIQNGTSHIAPDMAGTEPLSTKIGNFISDNLVLEIEGKASLGVQAGIKAPIGNADINVASFDVAGFNLDLINPSNSTGGWLNEAGSTKFKSSASIGAGFKGTPISATAGVEHSWTEQSNNNPFGYNSETAKTTGIGQIGFYKKGNGFGQNSLMKGGNLTGSVKSTCGGCVSFGVGVKALLGVDLNIKAGIK